MPGGKKKQGTMHPQWLSFSAVIHCLPLLSIHHSIDPSKFIHLFAQPPSLPTFFHSASIQHSSSPCPFLYYSVHFPSPFLPLPINLPIISAVLLHRSPSPSYNLSSRSFNFCSPPPPPSH